MASKRTIAGVLAFLHELFPSRDVTAATGPAWEIVFGNWPDDEFKACAEAAAREPGRKFFPTPGEIAEYCRPVAPIDTDVLLSRIAKLGKHNPTTGWMYPTPANVREEFGDAIATAYIDAGTSRCFAPDDANGGSITRDIARRAFSEAIRQAHQRTLGGLKLPSLNPEPALIPEEPRERLRLAAGEQNQSGEQDTSSEQKWKSQVPAPSFPTTLRGRVAVARDYRLARAKAVQDWADANAEKYAKIERRVDADLLVKQRESELPVSPAGRQEAVNSAVAPYLPFPEFAAWAKAQGYVLVDGPLPPAEPAPKREHHLDPLLSDVEAKQLSPDDDAHDMDDVIDHATSSGATAL